MASIIIVIIIPVVVAIIVVIVIPIVVTISVARAVAVVVVVTAGHQAVAALVADLIVAAVDDGGTVAIPALIFGVGDRLAGCRGQTE